MTQPSDGGETLRREQRGLFHNTLAAVTGQAGAMVFGLGAMAITTRLLGAGGYGRLTVFFMALGVANQLLLAWPNLATVRFGREAMARGAGLGPTLWARTRLYLAGAGAAAALIAAGRDPLGAYLGLGPAGPWLLLAYALLLAMVEGLAVGFQAAGWFRSMAAVGAGVKLLNFLLLAALLWAAGRGQPSQVLCAHLVSLGAVLAVAALASRPLWQGAAGAPGLGRSMAAYAWPMTMAGLGNLVAEWAGPAVLNACRPIEDVGAYGVACQAATMAGGLRAAVAAVAWPLVMSLAAQRREDALRWYLDDLCMAMAALAGLGLAVAAMAAEAIPWVFGPEFQASVAPCQILLAGVGFTFVYAWVHTVASATGRVRDVSLATVAMALVTLAGGALLAPRLGPPGMALATLAAFAVQAALAVAVVNGVAGLRGARPGRRYGALLGLATALAVAGVGACAPAPALRLGLMAAAVAAWAAALRWSGAIQRPSLEPIRQLALPAPAARSLAWAVRLLSRPGPESGVRP